jgi:hypothetical protein
MICEGKYEIFKNILFVKINISRLINYLTKHVWKLPRILHVMGEKRWTSWFLFFLIVILFYLGDM